MIKDEKIVNNPGPTFWEDLKNFQVLNVVKALLCSFLNLIIYIILISLIVGFEQGSILLVDLYADDHLGTRSLNVGLFHFLAYYLALIMSLYPLYIYTSLFLTDSDDISPKRFTWHMVRKGIILFKDKSQKNDEVIDVNNNPYKDKRNKFWTLKFLESNVRKFLGVFLFILWSGLLVGAYQRYQIDQNYHWWYNLVYAFFVLTFLYAFWWITVKFRRKLKDAGDNYKTYFSVVNFIYTYQRPFFLVLIFSFIVALEYCKWSILTIGFQVAICMLLALYLTLYRTVRKLISERVNEGDFINSIRVIGFIVLLFIFGINVSHEFAESINPINVVLASLILLYTVVTILIKLYLYFKDNPSIKISFLTISKPFYYISLITILCFFGINTYIGNDLHELQLISKNKDVISVEEFYNAYKGDCDDTSRVPILYAAYGGGLKAHYWNYQILNKVDKEGCFDDFLAMSGVSGGGMGISNFTAMKYLDLDSKNRNKVINNIKEANVLSIELSYLLGADLLRDLLPSLPYFNKDRSHRSMTFYAENLNSAWPKDSLNNLDPKYKTIPADSILEYQDFVNEISFDQVYAQLFKKRGYFPNIIMNSTATVDKSGIVSAIRTDTMFPGTINLLDIKKDDEDKTLTYFEASSTCNRFPFISPAANVPSKGHFVDGGYFENSGVMSLISFKKGIQQYEKNNLDSCNVSIFKNKTRLFSVRNDKSNYVQSLLIRVIDSLSLNTNLKCNVDYFETRAVLTSILNLERAPTYLREYLDQYHKDEYQFYFIDLPFYIQMDELEDFFGGKLNEELLTALQEEILKSNAEIVRLLNKIGKEKYDVKNLGVINPPTARLLSRPVELYIEAMVEHENVEKQLDRLLFPDGRPD